MTNIWWLVVRTPTELHLFELGAVEGDEQAAAVAAALAKVGVPEDWFDRAHEGWDVSLTAGEPHPTLLARATTVTRLEDGT